MKITVYSRDTDQVKVNEDTSVTEKLGDPDLAFMADDFVLNI